MLSVDGWMDAEGEKAESVHVRYVLWSAALLRHSWHLAASDVPAELRMFLRPNSPADQACYAFSAEGLGRMSMCVWMDMDVYVDGS